jgi:hypothetical protein
LDIARRFFADAAAAENWCTSSLGDRAGRLSSWFPGLVSKEGSAGLFRNRRPEKIQGILVARKVLQQIRQPAKFDSNPPGDLLADSQKLRFASYILGRIHFVVGRACAGKRAI